jgi:hypothetical protein
MLRACCAFALAVLLAACGASTAPAVAGSSDWSTPYTLSTCPGSSPEVLFPAREAVHSSGPGAVAWEAGAGCDGGAGARVAHIDPLDVPGEGLPPLGADGATLPAQLLAAATAPHGEVAILGGAGVIEGPAEGPFAQLPIAGGLSAPFSLATAWLGDLGIAGASAGGAIALHVERFFSDAFTRNVTVAAQGSPPGAVAVALDYRTDALVAWQHAGYLYARELSGKGGSGRLQRIAPVPSRVAIGALLSDDYRGILAWSEQSAGHTSVYFDQSAPGVHFGVPQLLERFADPPGPAPVSLGPRLVRLSDESVMIAWPGAAGGRWVVRTAAIDQHGIGAPSTIAAPSGDALLCDIATGPLSEAIVLWTEPAEGEDGPPDATREALFAARGIDSHPRRTIFEAPEEVALPGPTSEAAVAVDPASGRALAVWRGAGGALHYALRASSRAE